MFEGQFVEGVGFLLSGISGPIHEDFQCAIPDPLETDGVLLCTDGGIYRYSASANAITSLSATLGVTQVYRMDVHERHGGLIAIGSQDLGNSVSFADNGNDAAALLKPASWQVVQTGDGRSDAFREDNTSRVYLANTDGRVRKYDGVNGVNLQGTNAPNSQAPLLFNDNTLFYADTRFWRLVDPESKTEDTADWMPFDFPIVAGQPASTIQSLATCSSNKQVVYGASLTGQFYYSDNGGMNWNPVVGLGVTAPIWALSPSPASCHDVLAGIGYDQVTVRNSSNKLIAGDRLFRKTDATTNAAWVGMHGPSPALPHAPIFAIARQPSAPDSKWFVAGDVGVFRTDDADAAGGPHWANATAPLGLPNTLVRDLRISADGNMLYAGTFGRGVWSMNINPPANHFGVRGTLTQGGAPIAGAAAVASGAGRIVKWLKDTITTGSVTTTAPIEVKESAKISSAGAALKVIDAESVSLVAPDGSIKAMALTSTSGGVSQFTLTSAAAAALTQGNTRGKWSFNIVGRLVTKTRLIPSVVSGFVNFAFTDQVSVLTGPDGEYTLEYLTAGSHVVGIFDCCSQTIDLQSNRTDVDFRAPTVGEFVLNPLVSKVSTGERVNYSLVYTITEGRSWRDLTNVQLRFRDEQSVILWVVFDTASHTFALVDPKTGKSGPAFPPGHPGNLETSAATLYLNQTGFTPNVPDPSSVTLTLNLGFKPMAAGRTYLVEVIAQDMLGHDQGPEAAGTLQVQKTNGTTNH